MPFFSLMCGDPHGERKRLIKMKLRVTTFNIQHGSNYNLPGDVIDLPLMAQTAASTGASVYGFNEVRRNSGEDPAFPDIPAILGGLLGGDVVFGRAISLGEGKDYGNALVSKLPIETYKIVPIPDPATRSGDLYYETRSVIHAKVNCRGKMLTVLSTHFGLNADERRSAADTVLGIAAQTSGPLLLMGDLNTVPEDPVYRMLSSVFTDAAAALHNAGSTFPSDAPRMRIDYIFLRGVRPLEIHTVKEIASDHLALTAEVEF